MLTVVSCVDPAIGLSDRADYFVLATGGIDRDAPGQPIYLLDIKRGRFETHQQVKLIEDHYAEWRQSHGLLYIGIENLFFQNSLVQTLKHRGNALVRPIDRRQGNRFSKAKKERALSLAFHYEQGRIKHPTGNPPWLDAFEEELLSFTGEPGRRDEHDDQVDAWCDVVDQLTLGWSQPLWPEPRYHDFTYDRESDALAGGATRVWP